MVTSGTKSVLLFLLCFTGIRHADASKDGIVGFGISLYPDLCCQACHDSLSALYLSCTTFHHGGGMSGMDMRKRDDMVGMEGMETMGMTSDECRANNTAWLQTMAYCIRQRCDVDRYPADKQAECFRNQAVGGAPLPTFRDSLPATAPTVELAEDAMWLNVTSLVNSQLYFATHGTLGEFAREEYLHTKYSVALYFTVIGICILCGLQAQTASMIPSFRRRLQTPALWSRLQQHLFLPALLGSRRLEPLPGRIGYVPGRALSSFIAVYVILNVVFSAVSFRTFQPNIYFFSPQFETCEYVGNRTGTLSLANMSIAILFAGRNNVLIALTGWSQTTFLTLHRWTARVAAVQAVVHSIVYTLAYFQPGYEGAAAYAAKAAEPFYWWGIIATIAMCLAAAFAFLPFRASYYECFLLLHIALVVLTLIGCWYHLVPHFGFDYGYQVWLYICFAFWSADRLARFVRVAYYNPLGGSKAIVETVPDCDGIMCVTVFPRVAWGFGPAQHTFLYLPGLQGKFWESHPFSVAGWSVPGIASPPADCAPATTFNLSDSNEKVVNVESARVVSSATAVGPVHTPASIRFLIRAHTGVSSTIRRQLLSSPSQSPLELSVYTEGPYAGHRATLHPLYTTDTILCIAGGIGITHILGVIQEFEAARVRRERGGETQGKTRRNEIGANRFVLAWSAREMALIEHVKKDFLADAEGVECLFWCTGSSNRTATVESLQEGDEGHKSDSSVTAEMTGGVKLGRMNIESVLRASAEHGRQTAVLVCAPGAMVDEVTRQVVKCVRDGLRVDLVEEAFAW
ncbi:fcd1ed96-f99e-4d28-9e70-49d2afc1fed5 [Achaetomium macrosporum]|uniref:Fcd1ed96-f99e-4d28-9e70-49d2afc1fed5 n=1 Tax=Achaetomium macrosporum TaxID=79813 RepID=A0AAN7C2J9_9PEZI|nr:fcd1ed96-f99e-4d28-9e70-49d2afc1fed5 [Achaetomium macrosporum]